MKYMQKYDIPVATNEHLKLLDENNNLISKKNQTKYRSRVGMLLYLVKFLRPDLKIQLDNCQK